MQPPSTHHVSERVGVDETQSILSTVDHNHLTVHSMAEKLSHLATHDQKSIIPHVPGSLHSPENAF